MHPLPPSLRRLQLDCCKTPVFDLIIPEDVQSTKSRRTVVVDNALCSCLPSFNVSWQAASMLYKICSIFTKKRIKLQRCLPEVNADIVVGLAM